MVLLTDGRANVSLAKSNDDPDAANEKPSPVTTQPHTTIASMLPCPAWPLLQLLSFGAAK